MIVFQLRLYHYLNVFFIFNKQVFYGFIIINCQLLLTETI